MLELPPTFDLSAKQQMTGSTTTRLAGKQPQLVPSWFGGSSTLNARVQRMSVSGSRFAHRTAALLSDKEAFKFLSRCLLNQRTSLLLCIRIDHLILFYMPMASRLDLGQ